MRNLSPAQVEAIKEIDVTDLENDKVVMFQKKWVCELLGDMFRKCEF